MKDSNNSSPVTYNNFYIFTYSYLTHTSYFDWNFSKVNNLFSIHKTRKEEIFPGFYKLSFSTFKYLDRILKTFEPLNNPQSEALQTTFIKD